MTTNLLLGGRVKLRQAAKGYRAAIDPVLLAAAVPARPGQHVLELGCGVGAAMFCLAARVPELRITGVELEAEAMALAQENAALNSAKGVFSIVSGDARHVPRSLTANSFNHAMMNPPYHDAAAYDAGALASKTCAHAMAAGDLALWIKSAHVRLKPRGTLTVIYRADGLAALLAALRGKFGGLAVFPLWPRQGVPAKRVLVQGVKDGKAPLRLCAGLILHETAGYGAAAEAVLHDGGALRL